MVTIGKEKYSIYGECISFTSKDIKLLVTIDLGPRIIFYGKDGVNIMFEDINDTTSKGGEFFENNLKGEGIWHLYGGHRLWKSPEYMDTYYPDNKKVDVKIVSESEAIFTSNIETTTKLQKSLDIKMSEDGKVTLKQTIKNLGNDSIEISAWGLTVLDNGAKAIIPLSKEDTGFLPNRNIVYWPYTNINDERIKISNENITIEQKDIVQPIKIGLYTEGEIKTQIKGTEFSIHTDKKIGTYPDFSCNYECYTNNYIFEIETLSPLKVLAPGDSIEHVEYWALR